MVTYILTGIILLAFVISFKNDKRKLINAFLFLLSLGLVFISLTKFAYNHHLAGVHQSLIIFLYGVLPIALLLFAFYMIVNGFITLKRERKSLANSLSIFFGLGVVFYLAITGFYFRYNYIIYAQKRLLGTIIQYAYTIISFFFIVFIFIFFSFLAYSILYLNLPKNKDYDYIIIHGSGLIGGDQVSPLLASRIEKAIEAYQAGTKENVKLIASGGQGRDEKITEANAIADYLLNQGISKEDIVLEDKSTTTYENLKYSRDLVSTGKEPLKFLFVTNNYHVFRASLYARRLQMKGEGVGSKTAGYYIPSAFLREYLAILNKIKWILIPLSLLFLAFVYISR